MKKDLYIARPTIFNKKKLKNKINEIISSNQYTNNGPNVLELEKKLKSKFNVENLSVVSNGTSGLNIAIKALEIKGEIITTPFTYIATTSSILWSNCKPVYCDISLDTFNIDEKQIEKLITKKTKAIIATHVFGNPCNIHKISNIAKKYKLKVIYDASHCWMVKFKNKNILDYGDISVISFNATKIFHTIEGGACVTRNKKILNKINQMKFFGYDSNKKIHNFGINAKMSEFHAAVGLTNLDYSKVIISKYRSNYLTYKKLLSDNKNIFFQKIKDFNDYNFSYLPIVFYDMKIKKKVLSSLSLKKIFLREYFDVSLDNLYSSKKMKNSNYLTDRIICLPIHTYVSLKDIKLICKIINSN